MNISDMIKQLIPITQFNKGKASQLFMRAQKGETLVVIKNNTPIAVVLSPEEYEILSSFPKTCVHLNEHNCDIDKEKFYALLERHKLFDKCGDR